MYKMYSDTALVESEEGVKAPPHPSRGTSWVHKMFKYLEELPLSERGRDEEANTQFTMLKMTLKGILAVAWNWN